MPNAAPPARYDLPWKAALSHAFHPFLLFYFPEVCASIDWRQRPRFRDKELARCGFGSAPDSMVADKLVELRLRQGKRQVLIHVEIQAQRDAALARRMRNYHDRIRDAYGSQVISLALLADEHPHWRPDSIHEQLAGTMTDFSFGVAKPIGANVHPQRPQERPEARAGTRLGARTQGRRGRATGAATCSAFRAITANCPQKTGQGQCGSSGGLERRTVGGAIAEAGVEIKKPGCLNMLRQPGLA